MTEQNNRHTRKVTISRSGGHKAEPADTTHSGRRVVAVRLRNDSEQKPRPLDVLSGAVEALKPQVPPAEDNSPEADQLVETEVNTDSEEAAAVEVAAENTVSEETAAEVPDEPLGTESADTAGDEPQKDSGEPADDAEDTAKACDYANSPSADETDADPSADGQAVAEDACAEVQDITDGQPEDACVEADAPDDDPSGLEETADQSDEPADDRTESEETADDSAQPEMAAAEAPDNDEGDTAFVICDVMSASVTEGGSDTPAAEDEPSDNTYDEAGFAADGEEADNGGESEDDEEYDADEDDEPEDVPSRYVPEKWYIPQRWADIGLPRKIVMGLSVALFLFSCLPLFVGVLSPGMLPPVMIAAFFFLCALYWPLIDSCETTWGNVLIAVVAVCVLAGVTYLSFVSGKMISASTNTLPENRSDVTVVVLGCKIRGDQPSRMLKARLDTAGEFLLEHPQAHCIVTGGMGADEEYPEALVMKNYLVDMGVSPMRIVMETKSTSTLENITNAAAMAEQYNCHERFLIVTDRFHQYRAMRTANNLGIVSYALNVETEWYLVMPYWFREMVAVTRDWLTT